MIAAVILAAGLSSRMGRTKALLPLGETDTFLSRIVQTFRAAGVDEIVAVLGHDAAAIEAEVRAMRLDVRIVVNPDYLSGQFSSVLTGLNAVDRPGVDAMLMTLVDVPLVSPTTVEAVLERYRGQRPKVVRPVRGSEHGHPVLIDRALFDALRASDPSSGAKPVVRAHVTGVGDVAVDDAGAFLDIDTPQAFEQVTGRVLP